MTFENLAGCKIPCGSLPLRRIDPTINAKSFARSPHSTNSNSFLNSSSFFFSDVSRRSFSDLPFPRLRWSSYFLLSSFCFSRVIIIIFDLWNFPCLLLIVFSMEASDSRNKLHSRLRLWEFPDQYLIEPADGSGAPCLDISRVDASMKLIGSFFSVSNDFVWVYWGKKWLMSLILFHCVYSASDQVAESNSLRVPKIRSIFGVVGMLKLLAG